MADTTGATSANLSCLTTTYYNTLHAAQVHNFYKEEIIQTYGSDLITSWMDLNSTNSTRPAKTFYHYEQDRLNMPITTTGGSGIAGANVTLTISTGYSGSGTFDPTMVGYGLFQASTGNTFIITAVNTAVANAHTVTVAPPTAAVAISIASGEQLVIIPAVFLGNCSTVTNSSQRGDGVVFSNTMQALRKDLCICDDDLASFSKAVTFFQTLNPLTGESTWNWYNAEIGRVEAEFRNAIEMELLIGQQLTNTTLTALGDTGTTGVIPSITSYGNTQNYAAGVGFQMSDLDSMNIVMEKNNAPAEYICYDGVELNMQIQKIVKDYFPNGAVQYDAFNGNKDEAIRWGFTSISTSFGRTFHFHNMKVFNMPNYLGVPGGGYIGNGIWMPASKMKDGGGNMVNYIEKVTLAGNGYDLGYDHWYVDGTGLFNPSQNRATTTKSVTFSWTTTVGIEVFAAKQLFYVQRA